MASERVMSASKAEPKSCILDQLTPREREVALMLRAGESNKVVAQRMGVELSTVKTHLIQMFRKIGVANRTEFVSRVFLDGWRINP
jgi:DNA-binding NarL/FixJ family response regulator